MFQECNNKNSRYETTKEYYTDSGNTIIVKKTNQNANIKEDLRTEDKLIEDLGIVYILFGKKYTTEINCYKVEVILKKQIEKKEVFSRILTDIYENGKIIYCDVVIGFWSRKYGEKYATDVENSSKKNGKKYDNGTCMFFLKIATEMKKIWNMYMHTLKYKNVLQLQM